MPASKLGIVFILLGVFGLSMGGFVADGWIGRAQGAKGTGSVAGWVYWGFCQPYPYAAGNPAEGAATSGPSPAPDSGASRPAPGFAFPIPSPLPAVGALVAVQGTALSALTDEEGFYVVDGVPMGTYFTVAVSFPRKSRPLPEAQIGRPAAPAPDPLVCAQGSSFRSNVLVTDSARPVNLGAIILPRAGPRPLGPGQSVPPASPDEDLGP